MGWLSFILSLITSIPKLIAIVKEIIALIHGLPVSQRPQAVADLRQAYREARKTGDTQKLNDLHDVLAAKQTPAPPPEAA